MGSGFTTFTAGNVLSASEVNNYLMEQSVMVFATTGARDSAITAPEAGMTAYINSGDSSEGLYVYTGTTWNKGPGWNAPWGYIGHITQLGALSTSSTTELTIANTSSFTWVTNRYYHITASLNPFGLTASDQYTIRIRNTSISGTILLSNIVGIDTIGYYKPWSTSFIYSVAGASTNGLFLTAQRSNGTGVLDTRGAADRPATITITDIGPSGAPN